MVHLHWVEHQVEALSKIPTHPSRVPLVSNECAGKSAAQGCSALEAVHRLHQVGALDDHLQPTAMPIYFTKKQGLLEGDLQQQGRNREMPANMALAAHIMKTGKWVV
jgi:hypothetical protein